MRSFGGSMRPSNIQRSIRGVQKDWRAAKAGVKWAGTPAVWAARKLAGGNSIKKG
jgi:hypothetical protein